MKSKKTPQLSTAKQRELGAELRRIRMRAGYLATDMSRMLGWPASTISRLESGLRNYQAGDIAIYLARAKATPRELDDLVALDRHPDDGYQVRSHPVGFSDDLPLISVLDTGSESVTVYDPVDIPRQLQIEPYIRQSLTRNGPALDAAVHARLANQLTSLRVSARLTFYLCETALLAIPEGLAVKHEQVLHLLITSSLPRRHIHLVPADSVVTDVHTGFTLYRHDQHRPVVHHQQPTTSLFLENAHDIAYYEGQLEHAAGQALSTQQTRDWLTSYLAELESRLDHQSANPETTEPLGA
ncbi:helix-turn-helix domain-containing protein [Amycolatopsis roodepoortensis]|uniref:Transcriptional regulator with XRE-family HTH domain n=1 Tax=Amycolatopsis roodepoortensis TaxID=700274 RepID=A0ABR9LB48_9PSEU|nr:helix-turn-helix transcriptional regulator [Amycolatopsis roodepoortensis]MBE1577652.1 transcriptional regulator with XRE-family HTH domain [Amycolatopsis roodepoortensis]